MTGQELHEHVRRLARDLDALIWVCANCDTRVLYGRVTDDRHVFLTKPPTDVDGYLVALHELGHLVAHEWNPRNLRLDEEAAAWRWAIEQALIPMTPDAWESIRWRLQSYANDRRFKRTPAFEALLREAEEGVAERRAAA